ACVVCLFFFSSRRRHTTSLRDWSSDVCSSDLIYVALFGRDTLTAAWEASLLNHDLLRGPLEELPKWQGRRVDDWRDEQPGKMLRSEERRVGKEGRGTW